MERRSLIIKAVIGSLAIFGVTKKGMSAPNSTLPEGGKSPHSDSLEKLESGLSSPSGLAYIGQCLSIEQLRTTVPEVPMQRISVRGYYTDTLVGGGIFYYDNNDTKSLDDGGMTVVSSGKRWKRESVNSIKPEYFGARGDGKTDDTVAMQKSLDAAINNILDLESKVYRTSNLFINGPLIVKGPGRRINAGLTPLANTIGNYITIACPESPTFHDLTVTARGVKTTDNLVGIYIARNTKKKVYSPSILMYNCNVNSFSGGCIYSEPGRHMGVLDNCQFEYSTNDCLTINGVDWNISHCAIGYTKNGNGIVINQPTNRIANSDVYFNKKNGILLLNNAINGYIANNVINSNGLNAIKIDSNAKVKQGHVLANNFFFNNSRSESGTHSNILLSKGIDGVSVSGNSHFTYSSTSQRPRYLLELGEGASASMIGDSYNDNSYSEAPMNNNFSSIINNHTSSVGSHSSLIRYVSQKNEHAFLIQDEDTHKKLLQISNRGELLFYGLDGETLTVGVDQNEKNMLRISSNLGIGEYDEAGETTYLKLGGFYIWDDRAGNLRIDVNKPASSSSGHFLFKK